MSDAKITKLDGSLDAQGLRFAIVVSRFNSFITERLLSAAVDALDRAGAGKEDLVVAHVPGAFELPLISKQLAASGKYDALIAIGCVLRGETTHYDYVCSETARGLQLAQMDSGVPIIFCVLTCDTLEQAIDRAGLKGGNKGFEAGLGAIEMARLSRKLGGGAARPEPGGARTESGRAGESGDGNAAFGNAAGGGAAGGGAAGESAGGAPFGDATGAKRRKK